MDERTRATLTRLVKSYGFALVASIATLSMKVSVPFLGEGRPFVLLAIPIIFSAWYGGFGPAVLATLICVIGVDLFFIASPGWGIDGYPIGLLALVIEGLVVSWIVVELREARARADASAKAADEARREAALALHMREEIMTFWASKLEGPISDFATHVDAARVAYRGGDPSGTATALEQLKSSAELMRRTITHWRERDLAGS
jgi:K+-sensing histidine kinase KdpD